MMPARSGLVSSPAIPAKASERREGCGVSCVTLRVAARIFAHKTIPRSNQESICPKDRGLVINPTRRLPGHMPFRASCA